jgi:hypothetical protein
MNDRDEQIAAMVRRDMRQKAIAQALGISGPAVAARIRRSPGLRRLRASYSQQLLRHLGALATELRQIRLDAARLQRQLEVEIDSATIDLAADT